jgi:lysophospholipase L1-like esterase
MRSRTIGVTIVVLGLALASPATTDSTAAPEARTVYLALGDSLAASYQPNGETGSGYAEQLFQLEQANTPDLRLVKLACPGERTSTIARARRLCPYRAGSQLDQAVAMLENKDVAFATIQVGSNDAFRCFRFRRLAFDQACIDDVLPKIEARLTSIVETLRDADPDVAIVGANYYDPLLAFAAIRGFAPGDLDAIVDVWTSLNVTLEQTYASLGVPVADIEAAFSSRDLDTIVHVRGVGDVPLGVARACQWTYACSDRFDVHPNTVGYAAMTRAWEEALSTA